jgi:hypothetical protein
MKKYLGVAALLLMLAACGDFQWFPDANPNVDTKPNEFAFTSVKCGAAINTDIVSDSVAITGLNAPTSISVLGGEYSVDNGTFASGPLTITNGQSVRVRPFSGKIATANTPITVTLTIGGVSASYTADTSPCLTGTPP